MRSETAKVITSAVAWAISRPVRPSSAERMSTAGIRKRPERAEERKVAFAPLPMYCIIMLPMTLKPLRGKTTARKRRAFEPTAMTAGSSRKTVTICPEKAKRITAITVSTMVAYFTTKEKPSFTRV